MQNITIYCASSPAVPQKYFDAAAAATRILVEAGYGILYGGGATGLMGCVADTVLACGGHIKGIIPRFMIDVEWEHKGVKDMVHVSTMHARKELLIKDTSAVLALPGGNGTLEELYEVLSLKKTGPVSPSHCTAQHRRLLRSAGDHGRENGCRKLYASRASRPLAGH